MCFNPILFSIIASCQAIGVPTGGEVDLSSDGFKTAAEFVCLPGYTLEGQQNLKCKGDGSWDFLPPSCGIVTVIFRYLRNTYLSMQT